MRWVKNFPLGVLQKSLIHLFLYIVHTSKTYILSGSVTSSIVCGNGLPAVSGRNNAKPPANTDNPPNNINGNGPQNLLRSNIWGASIPPIRADMDDIPIPIFLKRHEYKYNKRQQDRNQSVDIHIIMSIL